MPIAKWKCPKCKGIVDLDHFDKTECGVYLPADYAQSVLDCQEEQFPEGFVRVSSSSSCPRAAAIMTAEDVAVDPLEFNAMHTGTAWHALMNPLPNNPLRNEVEVKGVIKDIPIKGHIDRVLHRWNGLSCEVCIGDWKHQNDFNAKYMKEAKPEHIVQTSIYGELYAQQFGERPTKGVNWYHYTKMGITAFPYELWPLERCLEHKPNGSTYTVLDILREAKEFADGNIKWVDMRLVGQTFKYSDKNQCSYCPVEETCMTEAARF